MNTKKVQYLGVNTMQHVSALMAKMHDAALKEYKGVTDVDVIPGLTAKYGSFNLNTVQKYVINATTHLTKYIEDRDWN